MTLPSSSAFREAVTRSHTYGRQVLVCDAAGQPLEEVPVLGGNVLVGAGLVRRTATVQLPGSAPYLPRAGGLIWWDHPLLIRFVTDGESMDMPLMWPDEPEHDLGGRTVDLGCQDAMRIVGADSTLAESLELADDSPVADGFRRLLMRAGAPDEDAIFDLDDGGATFLGGATYEAGSNIGAVLAQWQVDHRIDLYAMPPAVYTLRPVPDPLTQEPVATWALGREVRLLGFRKRWLNRAKNRAIVEGIDVNGIPFRIEALDTNPDSPVRWGAPGVRDLVVEYRSDGIRTHDQGESVARSLLVRTVEEEIEAQVPVDPSLDRRDVVRIEEPSSDTVGTFALDTFAVPLAPGGTSFTVRRERALS